MAATSPHSGWTFGEQPRESVGKNPAGAALSAAGSWKERTDDPLNRYYRYPLARLLVRGLIETPITPNQVSLVQPFLAALAGYFVTFEDTRHLAMAAVLYEARSILDCADGTLARARNQTSPGGHAIDAAADWLSSIFLYAGIFWHFHLHAPPSGAWSQYLSVNGVLLLALLQGALRSFAADYYKLKYTSIFERGRDETADVLRKKVAELKPGSSIFAHLDVFIGRLGLLLFEHEWFDPQRSEGGVSEARSAQLARDQASPMTRLIAWLWSLSNGDTFLSIVVLTLLVNRLWEGQLFFASVGVLWIVGVVLLNGWFLRSASRRWAVA